MPKKPPSEALAALADRSGPIPAEVWGDFWDRLGKQELHPGEALAVLVSLTTKTPDGASISALELFPSIASAIFAIVGS